MNISKKVKNIRGFTLLELVISMTISSTIIMLLFMLLPNLYNTIKNIKEEDDIINEVNIVMKAFDYGFEFAEYQGDLIDIIEQQSMLMLQVTLIPAVTIFENEDKLYLFDITSELIVILEKIDSIKIRKAGKAFILDIKDCSNKLYSKTYCVYE